MQKQLLAIVHPKKHWNLQLMLVLLSGNTVILINIVTLRWAQLVPGWMIVLGQVNHLGAEAGSQVNSAWAIPLVVCLMIIKWKLGEVTGTLCDKLARIRFLTVLAGVWLWSC